MARITRVPIQVWQKPLTRPERKAESPAGLQLSDENHLFDLIREKMDVLYEHTQSIHCEQTNKLAEIARSSGIDKACAIEVIQYYARRKRWHFDM